MSSVNRPAPEITPYDPGAMAGRPTSREAPDFGRKLTELRKQRGLTQAEFAAMLGVSQKTVNHYERRTTNPSLELIQRLAEFLEVSPAELVVSDDQKSQPRRQKPGPKSQLEQVVDRVLSLPRAEQQRVIELLEDAVVRAETRKSA